ncbi:lipid-A-disaccharide synthase-related protein [Thermosynechococcaceae cyanobacterium BACA0444]|uniref:Lipid-A-disaccharide synthase-related protein n=1 Tax=Pseudocalidococcus azoricus BACA0444 TaxID=2918990 RepID=A0AAE4JVA5_9CYAN|nr:lipid-A-disaccharide synthase-related protein [Pseudocalidococcus azoricus]MDS3860145.1 lipid-A-disaccharide synthase-related protein [Pseudocalidococcus azoricus BACA0444]
MIRLLCLSNGHGEDLNTGLIIDALQKVASEIDVLAMPIAGAGTAYKNRQIPIIGPTQTMPSGGIFYMNPLFFLRDVFSGLILLTWQQLQATLKIAPTCDLILATGDIVVLGLAWLTGRPFCGFIVSTSSYYEGHLKIPALAWACLRSRRCQAVYTRDAFTAQELQGKGITKAKFLGYPIMDAIQPQGLVVTPKDQANSPPLIALFPGSRVPEAAHNLKQLLSLCFGVGSMTPAQFLVALVAVLTPQMLEEISQLEGWHLQLDLKNPHHLRLSKSNVTVHCYYQAFADILQSCDLVWGMAGTAVEQAVGLGKPVLQIPGPGPQFTYRFAEAQNRLLGSSVQTLAPNLDRDEQIQQVGAWVKATWNNPTYLQACQVNGRERVGHSGGSQAIARDLLQQLES